MDNPDPTMRVGAPAPSPIDGNPDVTGPDVIGPDVTAPDVTGDDQRSTTAEAEPSSGVAAAGRTATDQASPRREDWPRRWLDSPGHLDVLHRAGAVILGLGLWVFGILGLVNRLELFSTTGQPLLGLTSNGLLSLISLVVGGILIAAAVRGGRTSSTVAVVIGAAFMLSGLANVLVLDGPLNVLAFGISNVIFSLVAGGMLLILGAYGRFTGRLPSENPYQRARHAGRGVANVLPTIYSLAEHVTAVRELADAERAVARRSATPAQVMGVKAAGRVRRAEDRVDVWRSDKRQRP